MRIALVADLHGNRPATEALDADLSLVKPDRIICLGDIVGKGPSSDFTFDWAMAHCDLVLGGNWDYGLGKRMFSPADMFYWDQLGQDRLAQLRALPKEHELYMSGRRVRLFHGRPVMRDLVMSHHKSDLIEPFFVDGEGQPFDVVIYADAHRQSMRTMKVGLFVNVGSVGNALAVPKCCYALMEGEEGPMPAPFEIRLRQLEYDREQAVLDAENTPLLPRGDCFVRELITGLYSR